MSRAVGKNSESYQFHRITSHFIFRQTNIADNITNWAGSDAGAIFYLMRRDELKMHDFGKCWLLARGG